MDSAKRSRVEAWLQYGNDLGLGPYFVARTESVVSSPQASGPASINANEHGLRREILSQVRRSRSSS